MHQAKQESATAEERNEILAEIKNRLSNKMKVNK